MTCKECGVGYDRKYMGPIAELMKAKELCFSCAFWTEKLSWKDRELTARVGGHHYTIGREDLPARDKGFGGDKFTLRFFDGREVATTNLWHQGEIPAHFRDRLPDNAEFAGRKNG